MRGKCHSASAYPALEAADRPHTVGRLARTELEYPTSQALALPDAAISPPAGHQAPGGGRAHEFVPFSKEAVEQSVPDRFEQLARRYPQRIAVKTQDQTLSYEALNRAANRVAHAVLAQRGEGAEPVALLLRHGAPLIAAMIGVLKAGKFYVPLDPWYPRSRSASMLHDSDAGLLITEEQLLPQVRELVPGRRQLLCMEAIEPGVSAEDPGLAIAPDAFTYIMYTSGSTGQPKGVVENHRNVLHFTMTNTNACRLGAGDRLTLLVSCSFSAASTPIYGALLNGAPLYPRDLKAAGLSRLTDWLVREEITVFHSGTVFRHFACTLTGHEQFPNLRLIYWGGEPLTRNDVELYRRHFSPDCILVNSLGAAEMKCYRLYFIDRQTEIPSSLAPVGYAVEDTEVLLLDEAGRLVEEGGIGEIAVKTRYLAPTYWRRPELTRARFEPDPEGGPERIYRTGDLGRMLPDGCLLCLGRKDFQVKIRGQRIDVAEIESALLEIDGIREAVVTAREDQPGDIRLVAYVVPSRQPPPTVTALRRALARTLPAEMIPSAFVKLPALPRTPNGKLDYQALPPPDPARPELDNPFVAPRTPVEALLAGIWAAVLKVEPVGLHDNFLELGGHSLLATQVVARVREALGLQLPLRKLFETPTVAGLAVVLTHSLAQQAKPEEVVRLLTKLEALSEAEANLLLPDEGTR